MNNEPDMTGRNWIARVQPEFIGIKKAIRLERDRLFQLETDTGKEPARHETFYLEWLLEERARGFTKIVTNL